MKKTAIIISAKNEEKTLPLLLTQLMCYRDNIVLIDDGSTDLTNEIASKTGCTVLKNKENRGISYSIRRGLRYAKELGYAKAILMDADGQHEARFVDIINRMLIDYDFVMGNRFSSNSIAPDLKKNSNSMGARIVNHIFNQDFLDIACGYKGLHITTSLISYLETSNDFSIIYDLLFYELKEQKTIGVINMPALYDASQLLATRTRELNSFIISLCNLGIKFSPEIEIIIETLSNAIKSRGDFYLKLDGFDYYGFYIDRAEGYIIQSSRECQKKYDFE